jgi:hypothetical protein
MPIYFLFLISHKDFIKKHKGPQKYIGYKRKAGKKVRIAKKQREKVSRSPQILGLAIRVVVSGSGPTRL